MQTISPKICCEPNLKCGEKINGTISSMNNTPRVGLHDGYERVRGIKKALYGKGLFFSSVGL